MKKVLVVRTDRFGEFLLIIPALRAIKETLGNPEITAVVSPGVVSLAREVPYIDRVIPWVQASHPFFQELLFAHGLQKEGYDAAVVFNPSKQMHLITFLAGIPVRAGYARKWGKLLLSHRMRDTKHLGSKHETEYNLDLAGLMGASTADKTLSLRRNNDIMRSLHEISPILDSEKPLVAVHPFTSDPVKQWPIEYFKELIRDILAEYKVKVILVGGPQERREYADFFTGLKTDGVLDLVGETTLVQLAGVLRRCRLLVSGDSGPVHLASAVGTPVVAIFRSDLQGKTAKRWGPLSERSVVVERAGMEYISVEQVLLACGKVIDL
ncbi:MAG: glycosyltransferase family 9 protein [Candidatus Omnitrophica bacterium]|nr:glycosyltransferase family 9 protein [Candidatus Omnitrophota bacterium]